MSWASKDVEFSCASFDPYLKFVGRCPPTPTPTQMLKREFPVFNSQGIDSSSVSFQMILKALQSELLRLKFYSLSSKRLKIPEFNLPMIDRFEFDY